MNKFVLVIVFVCLNQSIVATTTTTTTIQGKPFLSYSLTWNLFQFTF